MRRFLVVIMAASVITAALSLIQPFITKYATDWVVQVSSGKALFSWGMVAIFGGIATLNLIINTIVDDIGGYIGDKMSAHIRYQLSVRYYEHLLMLPQSYFDNEVTGKIINRLSRAISEITDFLRFFSNNLLQMLLTTLVAVGILLYYSWPLAILFVLLIPANLYVTAKSSGPWQAIEKEKNTHFDVASGRFAEVIGQMRLVKSFGSAKYELTYFKREIHHLLPLTARQSRTWHFMDIVRTSIFAFINGLILVVLFYQTAQGHFTLGTMVMLLTLIAEVSVPMRNLSFFVDYYQRAVADSRDYIDALTVEPEPNDKWLKHLTVARGLVQFQHVEFSYAAGDKAVLHDITFAIDPGKKVALVGESGSGKTTMTNLLMDLYAPTAGRIMIDHQDITQCTRSSVRTAIATVFQEPALFSGTIRENIAYARPQAGESAIMAAAKAASAHEFIMEFPHGYDTEIGERGIKLSGGQRQRIAIARAILKDAPILILDEATSSLDSRSEHDVQSALNYLMRGRTTLIIAHRLSTIAGVDVIVTLKHGHVDEIGSPELLATTGGVYAQLLGLQRATTKAADKKLARFEINR